MGHTSGDRLANAKTADGGKRPSRAANSVLSKYIYDQS